MDNQELVAKIDQVIQALEGIEKALGVIVMNQTRDREAAQEAPPAPALTGWPWAPATDTQGFLSARWQRRDGNVYGPSAFAVQGPNSPVRGGDDANARVDVPSGAPRVAPYGPT